MIAGFVGKHPGSASTDAYRFDVYTERFERLPSLPAPRASASVIFDPEKYRLHYMGGLVDRVADSPMHWSLDVTQPLHLMTWETEPSLRQSRNHLQGVYINGTIYLAGPSRRLRARAELTEAQEASSVMTTTQRTKISLKATPLKIRRLYRCLQCHLRVHTRSRAP